MIPVGIKKWEDLPERIVLILAAGTAMYEEVGWNGPGNWLP